MSELKLGITVADFVCDEYGLPLKEHPGLIPEYENLVIFYESLFGKCCEPHAIGNLLSGRINRRQKKSAPETPRAENQAVESKTHNKHVHRGVQLESEDHEPERGLPFDEIPD